MTEKKSKPKTATGPRRYLRITGETLYDNNNKVIAEPGDEVEEGVLSGACVAWLLAEHKAEWVESK